MTQFSNLPEELVEIIFDHLLLPDLAQAILVCRHWKELVDQPARWKDFLYVVQEKNYDDVDSILTCKRFMLVKKLKLVDQFLNLLKVSRWRQKKLEIESEKVKQRCF